MGDQPGGARQPQAPTDSANIAGKKQVDLAFHAQFDGLSHLHAAPHMQRYEQTGFDMRHMMGALPSGMDVPYGDRQPSTQHDMSGSPAPPNPQSLLYPQQQHHQYAPQRHDPVLLARMQQQQYLSQQMNFQPAHYQHGSRPQPMQLQTQHLFTRPDHSYPYGMNQAAGSPVDLRFQPQSYQSGYSVTTGHDMDQYARRDSEPLAAVPAFPRGPPRKPKQSGHALWVGNLPPAATVIDLKDHFSRDATKDIQSLFLISKSNCAFVNYRSEAACVAAMNRFHDSRFHGVRLVCRLRRGSTSTTTTAAPPMSPTTARSDPQVLPDSTNSEEADKPTIVGSAPSGPLEQSEVISAPPSNDAKIPEKFFIVKSLTLQDLEASVRNGIWATQSHNEAALNRAFNEAENVYLIFSANKSGEYFGYARMGSAITGEAVPTSATPVPPSPAQSSGPQSIPTAATETAPRGHIIDDSARGTIFWEAELSDEESSDSPTKEGGDGTSGQDLGRPFKIEWVSTARLPFYRTRGLRNPWNANREVKIARDGTELEPLVGKRLVQMFHRPAPMPGPPMMQQSAAPYGMG